MFQNAGGRGGGGQRAGAPGAPAAGAPPAAAAPAAPPAAPGPSEGSTVEHFSFRVKSLRDTLNGSLVEFRVAKLFFQADLVEQSLGAEISHGRIMLV